MQRFPQVARDAIQFDLRIPIVDHTHGLTLLSGTFEGLEQRVEERIVVVRQPNPVRVLVEELVIEGQRVFLHGETPVQGAQNGVHVHLLLHRISEKALVGGETKRLSPDTHPFRREHGPRRSQHQEHPKDEYEHVPGLHSEQRRC